MGGDCRAFRAWPISPLVGEMSGGTERGAVPPALPISGGATTPYGQLLGESELPLEPRAVPSNCVNQKRTLLRADLEQAVAHKVE